MLQNNAVNRLTKLLLSSHDYWRCPHGIRCSVDVTVRSPSVRPSVPLTDIHRMPQPGRGWTTDIDRLATGARVAAAGSVMLRAEVWGSTETCSATVHVQTRNDDIGTVQLQAPTNYTHQWLQRSMLNAAVERHRNSLPTAEVHARFPSCQCSSV